MSDDEGRRLGSRYHIDTLIGRGGMGEVWRGTDETGTPVAIKTLQPQFADDPGIVQRFVAERHLLTSARDPHVVRVRDLVAEGSTLAIVMDLVPGGDLRALLTERGTLEAAEACRLAAQIASGLAAIHAAGIVHRDIKPENVLLDHTHQPPRAMLTDFGVAKIVEDSPARTQATVLAGTPMYLAPELALGMAPGASADIYSLGILLYELLCGVAPFAGMAPGAVLQAQTTLDPGRPGGIDDRLWHLLCQLVDKDPGQRPGDARAVAQQLERLADRLDGMVALPRAATPPPPVPAQPRGASLTGPPTQLATPPQSWSAAATPAWDTPTTLGSPGNYPGQPSYPGAAATPGPVGYASVPQQPPTERRGASWQLPVALGAVAVIIVAVVVFWVAGLRGQPIAATPAPTTEQSATPTPVVPAAVETSPDPVPQQPAAPSLPTGVGAYADGFVRAWGIGDRPTAASFATADTVQSLFQYDPRGGSTWARQTTVEQGGRSQVRYTDGNGASLYVLLDTTGARAGTQQAIVGASVEWDDYDDVYSGDWGADPVVPAEPAEPAVPATATGLPTTAGAYADELVRAWGAGDAIAADLYASDSALITLFGEGGVGGPTWKRTSTTSSAVGYTNADGVGLLLYLDPTIVSSGYGDGVVSAMFAG